MHYPVELTFAGDRVVLLWYRDDQDGVVVAEPGRLRVFASAAAALSFARTAALEVGDERPTGFDLDAVAAWCDAPRPVPRPSFLLDAWNLLADLAQAVGDHRAAGRLFDPRDLPSYDRLVMSCDIPALGASSSEQQLAAADYPVIAAALRTGLACLAAALPAAPAPG